MKTIDREGFPMAMGAIQSSSFQAACELGSPLCQLVYVIGSPFGVNQDPRAEVSV